jgi:hypothetical protein
VKKFYEKIYCPLFDENKNELAYLLFMTFDINDILDDYAKEEELWLIDTYFSDNLT